MDPLAFDFAFLEEAFGSGVHESLRLPQQSERLLEFFVLEQEVVKSGKAVKLAPNDISCRESSSITELVRIVKLGFTHNLEKV